LGPARNRSRPRDREIDFVTRAGSGSVRDFLFALPRRQRLERSQQVVGDVGFVFRLRLHERGDDPGLEAVCPPTRSMSVERAPQIITLDAEAEVGAKTPATAAQDRQYEE